MTTLEYRFGTLDLREPNTRVFHVFCDLPTEIRLKIWHLLAPRSAVVARIWNNGKFAFGVRRKVPVVLQVCRESRNEYLGRLANGEEESQGGWRYDLWQLESDSQAAVQENGVYINWEKDTIRIYRGDFDPTQMCRYMHIQNLAMEWGLRPCWLHNTCGKGVQFIQKFPNLKVLTLIVHFVRWTEGVSSKRYISGEEHKVTREIRGYVRRFMEAASKKDTSWDVPDLRVVPSTKYWETSYGEKA